MIALLQEDPLAFLLAFSALVMSLVLHEVGHAYAAHLFGDDTAKRQGRLSLNPLRHLDPLGTLLLLLVGFGWARPVPIYPPAFRAYRLGLFAVSVAGILVNLALAVLFALAVRGLFALDPEGVYGAFRGSGGSAWVNAGRNASPSSPAPGAMNWIFRGLLSTSEAASWTSRR